MCCKFQFLFDQIVYNSRLVPRGAKFNKNVVSPVNPCQSRMKNKLD